MTQIEKHPDSAATHRFSIRVGQTETMEPGTDTLPADFGTIYNFYGLVDGWDAERVVARTLAAIRRTLESAGMEAEI